MDAPAVGRLRSPNRGFFGATSDSGSGVKDLQRNKLKLQGEWCMAHMAHAATKEACGMNGDLDSSRNSSLTRVISRVKKEISEVQSIEKAGDLFVELCRTRTATSTNKLLGYASNRFFKRVTGSIRHILDK